MEKKKRRSNSLFDWAITMEGMMNETNLNPSKISIGIEGSPGNQSN